MSYSKCAMPSLSCLLSSYTIPISLFFNSKNFLFSSIEYNREKCGSFIGLVRRAPLRGVWGMLPQKFLDFRLSLMHFLNKKEPANA